MRTQAGAKDPDDQTKYDQDQTLEAVYFSKLQWILQSANERESKGGRPRYVVSHRPVVFGWRLLRLSSGVFETAPQLPLQLVMNIQSDGPPCVFYLPDSLVYLIASF